jgi:hypothetical protein
MFIYKTCPPSIFILNLTLGKTKRKNSNKLAKAVSRSKTKILGGQVLLV